MAHFAKLGKGNIIEKVEVVHNDIAITEQDGVNFLNNLYKTRDVWKQTSYNTYNGEHLLGGTPFRKNYATIGGTYDPERDAFIPPRLFESWTLNEDTCNWEPPTPYPDDDKYYNWNETTQQWELDE